jgi:transcription termination factor 2
MHFTPKIQLYEHQQQAVDWITTQEARYPSGGILAHDMGLGKTIDVLYHIANQTSDTIGNNLIVVPNNLLHQWGEEFHKYIEDCTRYDFIQYTTKTRSQNIREYRIVVTTYDTLISDYRKNIGDVLDFEWTRVFLDEAHEIRNSRSLRFGVINYIRAKTKWCLTGTPIWNSEKDIYSLKTFIGGLASDLVDKSYLHIRTKDILPMPDYTVKDIDCKFTSSQLTLYKSFERRMIMSTLQGGNDGQLLGCIINLRRMCNHASETSPDWGINAKFDKVCEIISKIPQGEKLVVFSTWVTTLNLLRDKLVSAGYCNISEFNGSMDMVERQKNLDEFRDGKNNIILITVKCGGVGINLVCANHVIMFEPQYSPFAEKQAIDRVFRIGQRKPVKVYRFYMKFTIEHWMNSVKDWKNVVKRVVLDDSTESLEDADENRVKMFQRYVIFKPQVDRAIKMMEKAKAAENVETTSS